MWDSMQAQRASDKDYGSGTLEITGQERGGAPPKP